MLFDVGTCAAGITPGVHDKGAGQGQPDECLGCNSPKGIVRLTGRELADRRRSRLSRSELTPFSERGSAVLFENVSAIEVTVVVEVVMDRGMGGGKLLEGLHVPELRHRSFSSSERLVGILSPIVDPPAALLISSIAEDLHRRSIRPKPVGYN